MHTQGSEGLASVRARPSFLSTYLRMQCLRKKKTATLRAGVRDISKAPSLPPNGMPPSANGAKGPTDRIAN